MHPVCHARLFCSGARSLDGRRVVVEPEERRVGKGLRHDDGRSAMPAAYVRNPCAFCEFLRHSVQSGQPGIDEESMVPRSEKPLSSSEKVAVMFVPANALPGTERLGDLGFVRKHGSDDLEDAGQESRTGLIGEHKRLLLRQRKASCGGLVIYVAAGGLSAEPFSYVPLICSGFVSQVGGGKRSCSSHRFVKAKFVANKYQRCARSSSHVTDRFA